MAPMDATTTAMTGAMGMTTATIAAVAMVIALGKVGATGYGAHSSAILTIVSVIKPRTDQGIAREDNATLWTRLRGWCSRRSPFWARPRRAGALIRGGAAL